MRTAEGKLHLFVAIDRTSKFAYAELHEKAGNMAAAKFLRNLVAAVPYAIHTCSPTTESSSPTASTSSTASATTTASSTGSPK
ncbi:Hypothetical protein SMa1172 (plasmid) [Sinorhizobium meliloti 1021]|uniref:Integrase catalytic domain-containing protein n=1 Tax=Rhizobium meliloti (strain 1021) TaxID=266834 RepID=Q92Z54_RHIME|nr:Hypothetical protein SMa1172 [Sinorhizobium meliloti 1021]